MAFVFQAKRNLLDTLKKDDEKIGPGYYFNTENVTNNI